MTHEDIFKSMHEDLLGDINRFHNRFGFKKNEKVGIPDDSELVNAFGSIIESVFREPFGVLAIISSNS